MWLPVKDEQYLKESETEQNGVTIQEGMQLTGGYKGTDMDVKMDEEVQLNIDLYQQERLIELKKERRHLREKILCADNCQMTKWSFMTGIRLNQNCPIDCPINELNGQMKFKTSISALEAYNSYFEIRDLDKNKNELKTLDFKITETSKGYENIKKAESEKTANKEGIAASAVVAKAELSKDLSSAVSSASSLNSTSTASKQEDLEKTNESVSNSLETMLQEASSISLKPSTDKK